MHCVAGVQAVLAMAEPTCRALWCRQFKRCWNLPAGHCVTMGKTVKAVLEPTCQALCYTGKSSFSNVGNYLPGTVLQ